MYNPREWHWIVGGDESRAWASELSGYVEEGPADRVTRIASEAELRDVLLLHGLTPPFFTAEDVRAECARRMAVLVGARDAEHLAVILSNAQRESVRLLRKGAENWTSEEAARAHYLEAADKAIEALREASNVLEEAPPDNFDDDSYWSR